MGLGRELCAIAIGGCTATRTGAAAAPSAEVRRWGGHGADSRARQRLNLYLTLQSATGPRADYTPSTEIPSHTRIMFVSPKR